jgi:hypothetical protein
VWETCRCCADLVNASLNCPAVGASAPRRRAPDLPIVTLSKSAQSHLSCLSTTAVDESRAGTDVLPPRAPRRTCHTPPWRQSNSSATLWTRHALRAASLQPGPLQASFRRNRNSCMNHVMPERRSSERFAVGLEGWFASETTGDPVACTVWDLSDTGCVS